MAKRDGKGKGVKASDVAALRAKAGPRSGFVRTVLYVRPEQLAALHVLARNLADERGALRPDLSEAARFALAKWLGKK